MAFSGYQLELLIFMKLAFVLSLFNRNYAALFSKRSYAYISLKIRIFSWNQKN